MCIEMFIRVARIPPLSRAIGNTSLLLLGTMLIGCGGGNEGPTRIGVQGSIKLDQQPLEAGRIRFVPQEPTKGPAASAVVTNGTYEIPAQEGVVAGRHRVEIEATVDPGFPIDDDEAFAAAAEARGGKVIPRNPVPVRYNRHSQLSVEVTPEGERNFDFQLSTEEKSR